jgi:hypothetical protein
VLLTTGHPKGLSGRVLGLLFQLYSPGGPNYAKSFKMAGMAHFPLSVKKRLKMLLTHSTLRGMIALTMGGDRYEKAS